MKKPTGRSETRLKDRLCFSREYRDLPLSAKVLYIHLRVCHSWMCHSRPDLPISLSDKELMEDTGMSGRTITFAKKTLKQFEWVRVVNGVPATENTAGVSSKYWILRFDLPAQVHSAATCTSTRGSKIKSHLHKYTSSTINTTNNGNSQLPSENLAMAKEMCEWLAQDPEPQENNDFWLNH